MNTLPQTLIFLILALILGHSLWSGLLLFAWLLHHRRARVAAYSGPRTKRKSKAPNDAVGHPRAKEDWVRKKVIYLASHLPSSRKVQMVFNRWHGLDESIGHTYAWEVMRECEDEIRALRLARRRRKPRIIPVGHTWALDLTFVRSPYGATFTVLTIIDAGSRKLLELKLLPRKCALTLIGHVLITIARFGAPRAIRTDNEPMFHSRWWRCAFDALNVQHLFGPVMQPWRNGRVERLIGTLKSALRECVLHCAKALQRELDLFATYYNTARPHLALGGLTPQEAWVGKSLADVQLAHAHGLGEELLVRVLAGFKPRHS